MMKKIEKILLIKFMRINLLDLGNNFFSYVRVWEGKRSVLGIFLSSHFVNDRQSGMEKEN